MQQHEDPLYPQMVEMVLSGSQRGVDFSEGGIQIYNKKWIDIESYINLGDLVLFRPDIPHRVTPIDENKSLSWDVLSGRWTIFSPIANINNEQLNEKETKTI